MAANPVPEIRLLTPEIIKDTKVDGKTSGTGKLYVSGITKDVTGISWVKINGKDIRDLNAEGFFAADIDGNSGNFTIQVQNKKGRLLQPVTNTIYRIIQETTQNSASLLFPKPLSPNFTPY
ncbi:MAG: hypothetical protein HC867_07655 [Bacteroidia bacterium]|nr:hypothetical protein [Bacteroidia bacterium]